MVAGGTAELTPLLLELDSLGPSFAEAANLHVPVGGLDGYLSTAALDRAVNRAGAVGDRGGHRKLDRNVAVGGGSVQIGLEVAVEGRLHVPIRGLEIDGPGGRQLPKLGDDRAVRGVRERLAGHVRDVDLAVGGLEHHVSSHVRDLDAAVRGPGVEVTRRSLHVDFAVRGLEPEVGVFRYLNVVVDLQIRAVASEEVHDPDRLHASRETAPDVDAAGLHIDLGLELLHESFGLRVVKGAHNARDLDAHVVARPRVHGQAAVLVVDV